MAPNINVSICKWNCADFHMLGINLLVVHDFHVGSDSNVFTNIISDKGGWLYH